MGTKFHTPGVDGRKGGNMKAIGRFLLLPFIWVTGMGVVISLAFMIGFGFFMTNFANMHDAMEDCNEKKIL